MCVVGVCLYMIAVTAVWLSPAGPYFFWSGPVRTFWIIPIALAVGGYLLACQQMLDYLVREIHNRRINELLTLTQDRLREFLSTKDAALGPTITALLSWRDGIERE